ncbi:MAG: polysaccharide biosynthesis C-terminal domain-containing protein [Sphingomonas sp.]|uniref:polysaccharide biosynthesis C-terminal domain-containing protein n=1 Tax=Sphingomonas sp. TaxID=28214 RepID=UPI003F7D0D68
MNIERPTVAITGANGFVGRNLSVRLGELGYPLRPVTRDTPADEAQRVLGSSDVVFHLAGVNRADDPDAFLRGNRDVSAEVAKVIAEGGRRPLVIVASSQKAIEDTPYGRSKLAGEQAMLGLGDAAIVSAWRLPNIFGKWTRPDYNSAVATFCHRIARGLPIEIHDRTAPLRLLHIDDLIDQWLALMAAPPARSGVIDPANVHTTTVGELADQIAAIAARRAKGEVGNVGTGFERALYATHISYLPESAFSYPLVAHSDPRGSFTEVLKTPAAGQISYFTAHPGVTRGGHYHHAKVEKFLVVHGQARFRFRHILTGAEHEVTTAATEPVVVETIPGWTHDVTNIGEDDLVAIVWANEIFDRDRPDTVAMPL